MRVVAFTGMPGAGKSEAVAVAKARGIPVVRMGEFVWEETRRRGLELADANVGAVATEMRQHHGMDYWAHRTCDVVLERHERVPRVVVDGVRNNEEVETFRARLGAEFQLVAITAPPEVRVQRLMLRRRADDSATREAILQRDERELGWGIAKSIALADHSVVNEGDLVSFRADVSRLLDRVLAGEA
jgi:dephospho-CoA kinase